jgi:hypothetical protein
VLAWSATALAAGPAVNIGTPFESGSPSVVVEPNGSAVVAWANTKDLAGATDFVQYCVLPAGATACSASGNLTPAVGASHVDDVTALLDGSSIVIQADVYGATTSDFQPVQEWVSTDGGASFTQPNGGNSVAWGNNGGVLEPVGGVTMPGGDTLGFGFDPAASVPTFHDYPLSSPPECSSATNGCPSGFATLEPATNPDQISNAGGNFAANATGVMGIFNTNFTNGPLECSNAQTVPFGTAFVYGTGNESPGTNDYNISPGQPNSAWKTPVTQADCNVEYPTVGAGPSGFGVLEDNELTGQTIYHRFDTATNSFDTPETTVATTGEQQPALSQDAGGGVYATYLSGGIGGPISLSYSHDGGTTWSGPSTLSTESAGGVSGLTSSVSGLGQGWAAWTFNGSVYAQSFTNADAVTPPTPVTITTSQTAGATAGPSISVPEGTVGETDTAKIAGANAASASGTMTYTLYTSSGCTAASAIVRSTQTVVGGVAPPSAPVTNVLGVGKYYWQATYSGNAGSISGTVGNQPGSSPCGSEELAVGEPNTIGSTGTSNGSTVTLDVGCAAFPCTVTITITAPETITINAHTARVGEKTTKTRKKTITLGKGKFTLKKKGSHKLAVKLAKAGRTYLAKRHGKVKVGVALSEKLAGHTLLTKHTVTVKVSHPKKRK